MNPQALDTLRDIHLPPQPLWWQAAELWLALALVAAAFAWAARRAARRRRLRAALRELDALSAACRRDGDAVRFARGVSGLLRGYAALRFPHAGVEGLAGCAWLDFLDAHGGNGAFSLGAGAALESLPYQAGGTVDADALAAAVRAWLCGNPQ